MANFEWEFRNRIEKLEAEVRALRKAIYKNDYPDADRCVTVVQVADLFEVSPETVEQMEDEFAGLRAIKQTTADNRIYWDKEDFGKWLAEMTETSQAFETETDDQSV